MSVKISRIAEFMDEWAPQNTAEEFDNVGLLVGDGDYETERIMTTLDATPPVIAEAIEKGCGLIVAHHPLFRRGLKRINGDSLEGRKIIRLLESKTALFTAHTNLDKADGGVNDLLCETLGLRFETVKDENGRNGLLRIAVLERPEPLGALAKQFAAMLPERAPHERVGVIGDSKREIRKIAVCSGCGMSLLEDVSKLSVDLFISGDVRYHDANTAMEYGFALLDLTHYATEVIIAGKIKEYLERKRDEAGLLFDVIVSEGR